jgi:ATP-binding cassette subfamily C protein CydCD
MAAPLTPSPIGWIELWGRLFGLVRDWWLQLSITFLCGIGHVAAIIGIGVVSALIVGKVARGQEFTTTLIILMALIPLSSGLHYLESWLAHDLAYRLLAELRVRVYQLLDRLLGLLRPPPIGRSSSKAGMSRPSSCFFAHTIAPRFRRHYGPRHSAGGAGVFQRPLALVLLPFLLAWASAHLSPAVCRNAWVASIVASLGSSMRKWWTVCRGSRRSWPFRVDHGNWRPFVTMARR